MFTYPKIKQLKKELKCSSVDNLLALSKQNDPFYCGSESDKKWAEWLWHYWQQFGYRSGVHIRRIHYQLISVEGILDPNGEPYLNTEKCWDKLVNAAKYLRYLGYVEADQLVDRRSPDPIEFFSAMEPPTQQVEIKSYFEMDGLDDFSFDLPDLPLKPRKVWNIVPFEPTYMIEFWCEKSTMNDILLPFCREYGFNLVTGVGELSITRCEELYRRAKQHGKPTRIFYISDFDPAGRSMPVAVARKIEFYARKHEEACDIRLFPIVLTLEQIQQYRLPRTPIKESERRAAKFEQRFGEGAVELDALEAQHPGELRRILEDAVIPYLATNRLNNHKLARFNREGENAVKAQNNALLEPFEETLAELSDRREELAQEFEAKLQALIGEYRSRFEDLRSDVNSLYAELETVLEESDPIEMPPPEKEYLEEEPKPLFDSQLDYLEQIKLYKEFQGKLA